MSRISGRVFLAGCGAVLLSLAVGCATGGAAGPLSDQELADAVSIRVQQDQITAACHLMVTAEDGVVYLRGKAPTSNMVRARAVSLALGTPGVVEVVDDLYPPTNGVY
ncbi:MAG: BON domain-containing protein [Kiritimatiellae bacterium]|nr:BON domain-containing protein [Kiritimatiellia bacterium]MDD4735137.1 BON domain-containing protein [Kiritimatiellia bacterium]